jgi:hypothetical protein
MPALAISPYAKQGAVIHTRYDQLSILRTAELVLGLKPAYLAEAHAVPMYDAFSANPRNAAPYAAIQPNLDMTATNSASAPKAKLSASLPLNSPDQVSQETLDRILWKDVHGRHAAPPPPGPNASAGDDDPGDQVQPAPHAERGDDQHPAWLREGVRRGEHDGQTGQHVRDPHHDDHEARERHPARPRGRSSGARGPWCRVTGAGRVWYFSHRQSPLSCVHTGRIGYSRTAPTTLRRTVLCTQSRKSPHGLGRGARARLARESSGVRSHTRGADTGLSRR